MDRLQKACFGFAVFIVGVVSPLYAQESVQRVVPTSQGEVQLSYAPLVSQSAPAVVNIYTKKIVRARSF